jgi:arsenical pump membrane protein
MWPAQLASLAATMAFLWWFYWRRRERGVDRYLPPPPHQPADRALAAVAGSACVILLAAIMLDAPLWAASGGCALVVVTAFALRRREALRPALVPWRLLVFVTGLFLVVETIGRLGLSEIMAALIGSGADTMGLYRAAVAGAGLSNLVNNLPAYVAGEAVIERQHDDQLLALLIGTNVGPIITPWASLATLLWYERCRANGVAIPMLKLSLTGAGLAVVGVAAAVAALSW